MRKFLLRLVLVLVLLGALGFVAFAFVGDLSPQRADRSVPVTIDIE